MCPRRRAELCPRFDVDACAADRRQSFDFMPERAVKLRDWFPTTEGPAADADVIEQRATLRGPGVTLVLLRVPNAPPTMG